ncbi:MAG: tetraacyldisaccharide 4'-kinase [Hydrogenophilales bacterium 16-64-46]|nr:MAG: tetraacyldisaccharide 4'-kinase [Hydrogenophilales bacterium 12-64-13]OYZ04601.1 MAG: tetraacyldisaccharide 4'-kinase [Hydrogenophilales bacterium 16-64-46]OZA38287.1 MAG: tetraacyldisaccharide 4'-kinase [Hydrogenophilales bacterium 17-64-34]HQS99195.1 tetraacyldisaccharide 4'-kinase [Thiobacillus sp.]
MRAPAHLWARKGVSAMLLLPLAQLFRLVAGFRRQLYRRGVLPRIAVGVPVVVVGNITAGGSGKTPLVIWLVDHLRARGLRPGVVSRGYGGAARSCVEVDAARAPAEVGDEPLLIHLKTGAPVVVGRDRVAAARTLLARHPGIDVIVSDDGLQHYPLHRDLEIAVIDATAGLGNGWPLPAGPLREPPARLQSVDAVVQVVRGGPSPPRTWHGVTGWRVDTRPGLAWRLTQPQDRVALAELPLDRNCLAVTGIGRPQGFFDMLARAGLRCETRAFPDHHAFQPDELPVDRPLLMTEKDAVKCRSFAGTQWWAVELEIAPEAGFVAWLDRHMTTTRPPG